LTTTTAFSGGTGVPRLWSVMPPSMRQAVARTSGSGAPSRFLMMGSMAGAAIFTSVASAVARPRMNSWVVSSRIVPSAMLFLPGSVFSITAMSGTVTFSLVIPARMSRTASRT